MIVASVHHYHTGIPHAISVSLVDIRRIVAIHTSGPYPGLRQIIGVMNDVAVQYLHTGEVRPFGPAGNGDTLNKVLMWPDGRECTLLRLKGNTRYALYQEQRVASSPVEGAA